MDNILIIPGNEQELLDRYFDNNKHALLKERLELVRKAASNTLPVKERREHKLNVDVCELVKERKVLEKKMFQAALASFAEQLCREQRKLCEQAFWQAPSGEEAENIISAPTPDLQPLVIDSFR